MAARSNDNYIGVGLNYIKSNKGLYFYYDNNLLILHDSVIPFLTLVLPDKEVPLYGCNIIKNNDNEYTLEFFQSGYNLNCRIFERDGVVNFLIENNNYPGVIIALYKEKYQRVIGIEENEGEDVVNEKKLSFYVDKKYFFQNVNISDYDVKVLDKIFITVRQKRISFLLDTVNTPDDLKKMTYVNLKDFKVFRKRKVFELTRDLYSVSDNSRDGLIIKDCDELDMVDFLTEHYGKIIYCFRPEYKKGSHFISYFSDKELILQKNGTYKINFKALGAVDGFKTVVRKYFDTALAGIYLDTSAYSQEDADVMRKAIAKILPEYTKKIILFDRLPMINSICGYYVIRDRNKLFNHPELLDVYRYSGEYFLAAEVKEYDEIGYIPDVCSIVIVNNTL